MVGAVLVRDGRGRRRGLSPARGRGACRDSGARSRRRDEGARRDALRQPRAVQPPRADAALRRRPGRCRNRPGRRLPSRSRPAGLEGAASTGCAPRGSPSTSASWLDEAVELNFRFLVNRIFDRPQVTLKWAMSLDGKIATAERREPVDLGDGGAALGPLPARGARRDPGRHRHGARRRSPPRPPAGAVAGADPARGARSPAANAARSPAPRRAGTGGDLLRVAGRRARLRAGASAAPRSSPAGGLAGDRPRRSRRARGSSLLVEGGREVATAFFAADLFDRLEVAVAGRLLGRTERLPARSAGTRVEELVEAPSVDRLKARKCGSDLVLSGFNSKCSLELFANLGL
jgi:hypothetical protein